MNIRLAFAWTECCVDGFCFCYLESLAFLALIIVGILSGIVVEQRDSAGNGELIRKRVTEQ
eukprot:15329115-Ditylum_brightwellii.AAC.1